MSVTNPTEADNSGLTPKNVPFAGITRSRFRGSDLSRQLAVSHRGRPAPLQLAHRKSPQKYKKAATQTNITPTHFKKTHDEYYFYGL